MLSLSKNKTVNLNVTSQIHKHKYTYELVECIDDDHKVTITCPKHGPFDQIPSSHISGKSCNQCGHDKRIQNMIISKNKLIFMANYVHGAKYDYSKIEDALWDADKITVICKIHGDFRIKPTNLIGQAKGCTPCVKAKTGIESRWTNEEFIDMLKKVHVDDLFDYSKVDYLGSEKKITVVCKKHGDFDTWPYHHLRGSHKLGCPTCNHTTESFLMTWLQENYDKEHVIHQWTSEKCVNDKTNKRYRYDFIIGNVCIELDGPQHFKNVPCWNITIESALEKDVPKMNKLLNHNMSIIRIKQEDVWYNKIDWQTLLFEAIDMLDDMPPTVICIGSGYENHMVGVDEAFDTIVHPPIMND